MRSANHHASKRNHHAPAAMSGAMDELRTDAVAVGRDMRRLVETAGESALQLTTPAEEYIRQQPIKSILMAAGVGALLGMFFLRR